MPVNRSDAIGIALSIAAASLEYNATEGQLPGFNRWLADFDSPAVTGKQLERVQALMVLLSAEYFGVTTEMLRVALEEAASNVHDEKADPGDTAGGGGRGTT